MADDELNSDQEYQFSDEGEQTNYTDESTPVDPTEKTGQLKKILYWTFGTFVILFAIYKLFGGSPTVTPSQPELTPSIPAPPSAIPTSVGSQIQTNTRLEQQVENLVATVRQNQLDIRTLRSLTTETQNTMERLNTHLINNRSAMESLEKKLASQPKPLVTKVIPKRPVAIKKKRPVKKVRTPPPPTYYIQAVIPGRAWIQSSKGKILTISEGEHLRGYGAIKKIDAMTGKIYTSYGRTITFSPEEI